ncbi:polysaccharide deacetylase family protein [Halalkalibacter okhensis]|uniref:Polysaccharide deacetylase n=1 Tax=Halalkalibacter okhensis TaxID=333138 RepID=A0A0B0IFD2_9BACI|nr:polysaccharide deacetylase family protein [Halalkalibacter okhensis]KHF40015.1 polysaccharide deacetylase [Halalkalibacter okhensis]
MYNSKEASVLTNIANCQESGIILTFDDGPSKYLPQFLDVLEKEGVQAIFFWQTRLLHHNRPWNRVLGDGHIIGAHTQRHPNLTQLSYAQQMHEIQGSKEAIETITGQKVQYFRPPFGQYNKDTLAIAEHLQLQTVMWDIASFDWNLKQDPNQIIENVLTHVQKGSIILLHELEQTLFILPTLIQKLKEKGHHFSTEL